MTDKFIQINKNNMEKINKINIINNSIEDLKKNIERKIIIHQEYNKYIKNLFIKSTDNYNIIHKNLV